MAKEKAVRPTKPRFYVRVQEEFVDLRTNPKPGHSHIWLIERDGAANEGRLHGCMLTQLANRLVAFLEASGIEVQRVNMPAGDGLHVGDSSDPQCMPEIKAEHTSKFLPPDIPHGPIDPVQLTPAPLDLGDLVSDLL